MKTRRNVTVLILLTLASLAWAQERSSIRAVGMGRTGVASTRGVEAFGYNPANLAIPDRGVVSIGLLPFSFKMHTELFSYDIYTKYFTGIESKTGGDREPYPLTDTDIKDIMSILPDKGQTRFEVEVTPVSFWLQLSPKIGSFGFAMTEHIGVVNTLNKDYFRVVLLGLPEEGANYSFDGTGFSSWWYRTYNISYARQIPVSFKFFKDVYLGASYKIVQGFGALETPSYKSTLKNTPVAMEGGNQTWVLSGKFDFLLHRSGVDFFDENKNADFTPFPEPAGKGSAFDFGLSAEIMSGIRLGASITDLGKIDWDKNIVETHGTGGITIANPFTDAGSDSLKDAIRGQNNPGKPFTTDLPTKYRIGVTMQSELVPWLKWLPGRLLLAADYTQGSNESFGNTTKPRVSLGAEYRLIPLIPLRTGLSFGGNDVPRWALGFGLDFWIVSMEFAFENFGMLFNPQKFQMFQLGYGLRLRI